MQWFRLYDDLVHNAKVQSLPLKLFRAYINLLCLASKNNPRGQLPSIPKIAFALHVKPDAAKRILDALCVHNFLQNDSGLYLVHNWNECQMQSDNSAIRKRNSRMNKLGKNITGQSRDGHCTDIDTDTEQIQIQNPPPTPSGGPELLFKIYNEHRGSLPEAKKLTSDRLRYCRARLSQNNGSFIEDWTMSVKKAAILPFCCGESDSGWCVSFDWLIKNNTNYLKITEGKYDNGRNERPTRADKNDKTAARFMARFDPENRSGIQRGAIGSDTRGLHGKPDEGES